MGITMPSLVFGFMLAALCGSAFHLWRGGNLGRLILYIILACLGFWIGHWVGDTAGLTFGSLGPLRVRHGSDRRGFVFGDRLLVKPGPR